MGRCRGSCALRLYRKRLGCCRGVCRVRVRSIVGYQGDAIVYNGGHWMLKFGHTARWLVVLEMQILGGVGGG